MTKNMTNTILLVMKLFRGVNMTVEELAKKTGRSRVTIYNIMKKLNEQGIYRLPTEEEVLSRKAGRPRKYKY